jgi:hypothetical protein
MNTQKIMAWLDEEMDMAYTVKELSDATGTGFKPLYLSPPKPENELDIAERAYFAGKQAGIAECEAVKREWVSLSNKQIDAAIEAWFKNPDDAFRSRMRAAIEANLKEKNT